jgi:hypothetical protein
LLLSGLFTLSGTRGSIITSTFPLSTIIIRLALSFATFRLFSIPSPPSLLLLTGLIRAGLLLAVSNLTFLVATLALQIRNTRLFQTIRLLAFLITTFALILSEATLLFRTALCLFLLATFSGLRFALIFFLLRCAVMSETRLCGFAVLFFARAADVFLSGLASAAFGFFFEGAGGFGAALVVCGGDGGEFFAFVALLAVVAALLLFGEAKADVGGFFGFPAAAASRDDAGGGDGGAADDGCVAGECAVDGAGHGAAETARARGVVEIFGALLGESGFDGCDGLGLLQRCRTWATSQLRIESTRHG